MQTITQFRESLKANSPDKDMPVQLKSLWYDGRGDWQQAHSLIDHLDDKDSAWVHAYLHRKEGDIWNADYWYRKAGKTRPDVSLEKEWEELAEWFCK